MTHDFVELAPTVRLQSHDVHLWCWKLRYIMHVKDLAPYLLSESVQWCEALHGLSTLFKGDFVSNRRCIMVPS